MMKIIHSVRSSATLKCLWINSKPTIIKLLHLLECILYAIQVVTWFALDNTNRLIKHLDRHVHFDNNITCIEYEVDTDIETIEESNEHQNARDQDEQQNAIAPINQVFDDVDINNPNDLPLIESNDQSTLFVPNKNGEKQNVIASENEVFGVTDINDASNLHMTVLNNENTHFLATENDNGLYKNESQNVIVSVHDDADTSDAIDLPLTLTNSENSPLVSTENDNGLYKNESQNVIVSVHDDADTSDAIDLPLTLTNSENSPLVSTENDNGLYKNESQNVIVSVHDDADTSDAIDLPLTLTNSENSPLVSTENDNGLYKNESQNVIVSVHDDADTSDAIDLPLTLTNSENSPLVSTENDNGTIKQCQLTQVKKDERRFMMKDMAKFHLNVNYVYRLRVLHTAKNYIFLAKVNEENSIRALERRINVFYSYSKEKTYTPQLEELCVIKYNDGNWYRGICKAINEDVDGKMTFFISLLDWGDFISVNVNNIRKIQPFFIQHAPLVVKCVLRDLKLSRFSKKILRKLSNKVFNCNIFSRFGPTYYEIKSDQISSLLKN
ncbi:uncharacterized protein LOC126899653 isoform X6 [Daktulosphaira vitifoliae]|uniref:uncharacterized protein LOC126899653 isoform X2 n=1 Tax=Daktulosphaira vitifoliae TaxID=58002 RepID=UPI0021AAB2B3|nr:uncharacterized protein LOC126899653 isoform X2 [Daktulosphaira vitifoliae]XP_050530691.1 uncharacterized protein LOC126899653 isoform X3 [Daktulosphaira vitifoliae]XP_050530700.1 uncharacterized protein LOC126899653 isoform X4 [Daktulosphaira vitifoliae]XP_050530709.1 uncharacterized protein LOC126899653 isoform X5 [Daktulosphaira vitifoliae]XP_050530716.1 uncharacterized protein LOC126899653 isoform X6 [Daktulosphaira vitifoliae]